MNIYLAFFDIYFEDFKVLNTMKCQNVLLLG